MTEHWPHAVEVALFLLVAFTPGAEVVDSKAIPEDGLNVGNGTLVEIPVPEPEMAVGWFGSTFEVTYLGEGLEGLLESGTLGGVFEGVFGGGDESAYEGAYKGVFDGVLDGVLDGGLGGVLNGVTGGVVDNVLEGLLEDLKVEGVLLAMGVGISEGAGP